MFPVSISSALSDRIAVPSFSPFTRQIVPQLPQDFTSATASLLEDNKNVLAQYMVDAAYINKLDEELRNLEIYTKSKKQAVYYQSDKPDGVTGDVWISD